MPNNEFGDFQTPLVLARQCLSLLGLPGDARILEPTCGTGAFLEASAALSPGSERQGLELHPEYAERASRWARVEVADIFRTRLTDLFSWTTDGPLFVVGNPPWVTSAELNRMKSSNLPAKANIKGVRGIDAVLGSSNFDVCEYIITKVLTEYRSEPFTLGMLCKTQVVRNVMELAASTRMPLAGGDVYRINSKKWFGAGVDACWFVVRVDPSRPADYTARIHDDVFAPEESAGNRFGVVDGRLVSDVDRYRGVRVADGLSPYEWRSGMKHDASSVFELTATPAPATRNGVVLDLEPEFVHPFLKSTDVFRGRHRDLTKWVIVPQKTFGAETDSLEFSAPALWKYLNAHGTTLDGRRSSIYRNRPRFTVFGHGDYTYAPYKVAVSGLHKKPVFRLVAPLNNQPVVLDDTCYFLPFLDGVEAAVVTAVLNSRPCIDLIESLVFWDSKRPITKKLLSRIDLNQLPYDAELVRESAVEHAAAAAVPFDEALVRRRVEAAQFGS
ncbi:restriction endonuclease NspV [Paractinoplanes abujensis]|uniref:Uncharacterized protein n=1 Tax=Paractinoplanes abujensis TaxID=882441 RepID=A0A7W7CWC0_9ACTN|nr:class I SAM-dependent methyltransferase [Actinoplanes abujensis]MBB4695910.1 hypothetical protein [Actinoplanes abujensis]GID23501.1 restriction endonuclease NspV [Actinoplanes abujensis]